MRCFYFFLKLCFLNDFLKYCLIASSPREAGEQEFGEKLKEE